jgi:uncharacterized protein (TIGR03083 family)
MGTAREDFFRERAALRASLDEVGPDAPTACGTWTTTELAVHVVTGELSRSLATAPFRFLVGRGVRFDWFAPFSRRFLAAERTRHGFEWAMDRLGREPPRLETVAGVAPGSLLEMWAHHEDVLAPSGSRSCDTGVDLAPVLAVLVRYQRRQLRVHGAAVSSERRTWFAASSPRVSVRGDEADIARWLCGRATIDPLNISGESVDVDALSKSVFII